MQIAGRESDAQTDRQDTEMQAETLGHAQIAGIDRERERERETDRHVGKRASGHVCLLAIMKADWQSDMAAPSDCS